MDNDGKSDDMYNDSKMIGKNDLKKYTGIQENKGSSQTIQPG